MATPGKRPANKAKGEADFAFEGTRYRFVFDWEALEAWEEATDSSFLEFLGKLAAAAQGGAMPKLWHLGEFMRCGLMRHHPDVSRETGSHMIMDAAVRAVAMAATGHAIPEPDGEGDASGEPGEPRGRVDRSGGSSTSSVSGSKPAAKKKRSGGRRRG